MIMEAFFGAMIGAILGVPLTALLLAAVFKPHESFQVATANARRLREVVKEANSKSSEISADFDRTQRESPDNIPYEMSLDPNK